MPQNATLSPVQEAALAALLGGKTITEAAAGVGIDRATLHRWLRDDFEFQARFNAGRRELRDAMQGRLYRLAERAADVVEASLERGDDPKTALVLLRGLGLLPGEPPKIGPDDPEALRVEYANARMFRDLTSRLAGDADD